MSRRRSHAARSAFTLAEVAVTIALVGIVLAWLLQSLSASKLTAAHARDLKLARELALLTLGQIESGLYEDELESERIEGNYSEEDYPTFLFEAVIGEQNFAPDASDARAFDNWRAEQEARERELRDEDEDEETEQPYEKIQIKVTFTKIQDLPNEYVLETWVPWDVLHPADEEGEDANAAGSSGSGAPGGDR